MLSLEQSLTPELVKNLLETLETQVNFKGGIKIGGDENYCLINPNGHLVLFGEATVYSDIQFSISTAKVPASNAPTWSNFTDNLKKFTFALNDYVTLEDKEIIHSAKEGNSTIYFHLHLYSNGEEEVEKFLKYKIIFCITKVGSQAVEQEVEYSSSIPANTSDKTHFMFNFEGVEIDASIGSSITIKIIRLEPDSGDDPINPPFLSMVGIHIEENTIGSNEIYTK